MKEKATYFERVSNRRRAVDLSVLSLLFVLALLGFQTVYGGVLYLLTGVMALVFALLAALIGARFRWGPLRLAPLMLGIYLLFGSAFAAPTRALFGIIPTPGSLWELIKAPVTSWKSVLTVAPPVGSAQGVLAVVWISMLLLALFSFTIVLRTRRYAVAWLFPLALIIVSVLFGTNESFLAIARGVVFAAVSIAWLTWRFESARLESASSTIISDSVRPGSWKNPVLRRRVIGGALILLLTMGGTVAAQALLDPPEGTQRFAVRDRISPPFDPRQYVSPLADFRGYIKNKRTQTLFTVENVAPGEKIRLATLDQYDLQVYNVAGSKEKDSESGAFLKTAGGVNLAERTDRTRRATFTIGDYADVWMPTVGTRLDRIDIADGDGSRSAAITESLYFNAKSQTAVNARGMSKGDSYDLLYEPYREPTVEQQRTARFADVELPDNNRLDPKFAQLAEEWAGTSESDFERFQNLSRSIKADADFSHGIDDETASLSGHSAARLNAMLEDPGFDKEKADAAPQGKIGDQEQFAVLTAVMARSLKMPARVVMGFEVPKGAKGAVGITGNEVTAWVEVAFDGLGWVRFDPAPEDDTDMVQPTPNEVEKPRPQVAQPPPPPAEPPSPPPGAMSDDAPPEPEPEQETRYWLVVTASVLVPLLLIAGVLLAIVIAKSVRRGRRRGRGDVADRVDGGWQEILDLLADMGHRPDASLTRSEVAARLQGIAPDQAALLASRADRAAFGPRDLPEAASVQYWTQVGEARRSMSTALPWHRRLRAIFSLRSFRTAAVRRKEERKRERIARRLRAAAQTRAARMRRPKATGRNQKAQRIRKKGQD